MEVLILLAVLLVAMNIAVRPLCRQRYRSEDAERIAEGSLRAKNEVQLFPKACWIISGIMVLVAILVHKDLGASITILGTTDICLFILCVVALFQRNTYYTLDDERLTCVKHGKEKWSHTWDEIEHARRRIVSTGKSFIVLYDITTREGVKHRSLPAVLERDLKSHVRVDSGMSLAKCFLILLLTIILIIFIIAVVTHKVAI